MGSLEKEKLSDSIDRRSSATKALSLFTKPSKTPLELAQEQKEVIEERKPNFKLSDGRELILARKSLFVFGEQNKFRRSVLEFVEGKWFRMTILILIIINSLILGLMDYRLESIDDNFDPDPSKSWRNNLPEQTELFFTTIFTLECVMKIIAMGFVGEEGCYLRDGWNWLDFLVVISGLMSIIPSMPKLSMLRTFRILRPLRSLSIVPGMRVLIASLLNSIPQLLNVMAFMGFVFFIFGIFSLVMWSGSLHARCRITEKPIIMSNTDMDNYLDMFDSFKSDSPSAESVAYFEQIKVDRDTFPYCGSDVEGIGLEGFLANYEDENDYTQSSSPWNTKRECVWPEDISDERVCTFGGNGFVIGVHECESSTYCGSNYDRFGNSRFINDRVMDSAVFIPESYGYTNFDWIGSAFLTIFQVITLEGWVDIMYRVMDASYPYAAVVYFNFLVMLGAFFMLNLTLAVIWDNFNANEKIERQKSFDMQIHNHTQKLLTARGSSMFPATKIPSLALNTNRTATATENSELCNNEDSNKPLTTVPIPSPKVQSLASDNDDDDRELPTILSSLHEENHENSVKKCTPPGSIDNKDSNNDNNNNNGNPGNNNMDSGVSSPELTEPQRGISLSQIPTRRPSSRARDFDDLQKDTKLVASTSRPSTAASVNIHTDKRGAFAKRRKSSVRDVFDPQALVSKLSSQPSTKYVQKIPGIESVRTLVTKEWFSILVVCLILINTVIMAMDRYGISNSEADLWEIVNVVLTGAFIIEMFLKLLGHGVKAYFSDNFNKFDCAIVVISIIELIMVPPVFLGGERADGAAGVSAMRSFRLFRVFKLAKNWKSFRDLLNTIGRTVIDVGNFAILLLLFIYIFALIGMQFFANRMHFSPDTYLPLDLSDSTYADNPSSRSNFDSLTWSCVTIFQILTGENWNTVMYDAWRATNFGAVIYFLMLVILGNFIVLNLFLAILLANFEKHAEVEDMKRRISVLMTARSAAANEARLLMDAGVDLNRLNGQENLNGVDSSLPIRVHSTPPLQAVEDFDGGRGRKNSLPPDRLEFSINPPSPTMKRQRAQSHDESSRHKPTNFIGIDGQKMNGRIHPALDISSEEEVSSLGRRTTSSDGGQDYKPTRSGVSQSDDDTRELAPNPSPKLLAVPHRNPQVTATHPVIIQSYHEQSEDEEFINHIPQPPKSPLSVPTSPPNRIGSNLSLLGDIATMATRAPDFVRQKLDEGVGEETDEDVQLDEEEEEVTTDSDEGGFVGDNQDFFGNSGHQSSGDEADTEDLLGKTSGSRGSKKRKSIPKVPKLRSISNDTNESNEEENPRRMSMRSQNVAPMPVHRSLFFFGANSKVRLTIAGIIKRPWFDNLILLFIIMSSCTLAIDNPRNAPDSLLVDIIEVCDWIFTTIFVIEMIMKIIVYGFCLHEGSYIRNGWNVLDFVSVMISVLGLLAGGNRNFRSLRSLRTLRAFRPLRVIGRNSGLKLVVNALLSALPGIGNVMFVCALFFLIFGLMGINLFKGAFSACDVTGLTDVQIDLITYPVSFSELTTDQLSWGALNECDFISGDDSSKAVCLWMGLEWDSTMPQNFNHVFKAMMTLFEMSTTEMWVDVMIAGVDSRGTDMQPVRNSNELYLIYFIIFMVFGCFFMMNLFVGVVIDNFNHMKEELGGNLFLTDGQKQWVQTQEIMLRLRPHKPKKEPGGKYRKAVFKLVNTKSFEGFIMGCIFVNTITMSMNHFGQSESYGNVLEYANFVFAFIFTVEALLKLFADRWKYFTDGWNIFDFAVVCGTDLGVAARFIFSFDLGSIASILRAFRVGRIIRIARSATMIRRLFNAMLISLPSLMNVGGLLFLMLFIYSIMGNQLFALVGRRGFLDEHVNFESFWNSMLILVRAYTGESWNGIMYDLAEEPSGCISDPQYIYALGEWEDGGCGDPTFSYIFWLSFTLVITFVLLNVFIAVILEGFDDSSSREDAKFSDDQIKMFTEHWAMYDPEASGFILVKQLPDFFQKLPPPMGFGEYVATENELKRLIAGLNLPTYVDQSGARVYFSDVCLSCARNVISDADAEDLKIPDDHVINRQWTKMRRRVRVQKKVQQFDVVAQFAAIAIQTWWRLRMKSKQGEKKVQVSKKKLLHATSSFRMAQNGMRAEMRSRVSSRLAMPSIDEVDNEVDKLICRSREQWFKQLDGRSSRQLLFRSRHRDSLPNTARLSVQPRNEFGLTRSNPILPPNSLNHASTGKSPRLSARIVDSSPLASSLPHRHRMGGKHEFRNKALTTCDFRTSAEDSSHGSIPPRFQGRRSGNEHRFRNNNNNKRLSFDENTIASLPPKPSSSRNRSSNNSNPPQQYPNKEDESKSNDEFQRFRKSSLNNKSSSIHPTTKDSSKSEENTEEIQFRDQSTNNSNNNHSRSNKQQQQSNKKDNGKPQIFPSFFQSIQATDDVSSSG